MGGYGTNRADALLAVATLALSAEGTADDRNAIHDSVPRDRAVACSYFMNGQPIDNFYHAILLVTRTI